MAANKFATMVHNNTNKITLILIYTLLEWLLILLLLLNSIFSYFITKFAQFFNLNPPCFWCARIDRLFEPETKNSFRNHLCELHSKEVSHLGFCSIHRKLAESSDMCEDCSSSNLGVRRNFVFSKVESIEAIEGEGEEDLRLKCSCCQGDFNKKFVDDSDCFVIHPSWDVSNSQKGDSIDDFNEKILSGDRIGSDCNEEVETEEAEIEVIRDSNSSEHDLIQFEKGGGSNSGTVSQFFIDYGGDQLFPFELAKSKTGEEQDEDHEFGGFQKGEVDSEEIGDSVHRKTEVKEDEDHEFGDFQKGEVNSEGIDDFVHKKTGENRGNTEEEDHEFGDFQEAEMNLEEIDGFGSQSTEESHKFGENVHVSHENLIDFTTELVAIDEETQNQRESDEHLVCEEEEASIGTEIPVLDSYDEIKHEELSTNSDHLHSNLEENPRSAKNPSKNVDEIDEEKAPATPSSIHSSNPLHKKWLTPETKESGTTEESFDGSTMSETDAGEPVTTSEKLKSALEAERKALHHLYSELEEERNASAVAANETMAMINRLQEEKAAMQMEALQYQRMMEEQSEYDQEALQLLNELMTKKEKELDSYRKKVSDYEAKEKTWFSMANSKTGTSSVSWSHSEDDDGLSVDLYQVPKEYGTHDLTRKSQNPFDSVLDLDSSLVDFEEERVSILEKLKVLEEKLLTLSDEEDRHFANIKVIEDHYEEVANLDFNGQVLEYVKMGKQQSVKRALPIFDEISTGSEDGENRIHPAKSEDTAVMRFELEKKRIDMEEEVDQLYGRLQALEADREFLKHCIGSIKKGDKGTELLQEILQHLRDLRNVNTQTKSYSDNALI